MSTTESTGPSSEMSNTCFRVGAGIGIVSESTLALLQPINGDLAERLWVLVSAGAGVDELLEELSRTGLRALGSFAMAQFEDTVVRLVVRGTAFAEVVGASGTREIGADGVRTWVEEVHADVDRVTLRLGQPATDQLPFRAQRALLPADLLQRGRAENADLRQLEMRWTEGFRVEDSLLTPLVASTVVVAAEGSTAVMESPPETKDDRPEVRPGPPAAIDPALTIASADYNDNAPVARVAPEGPDQVDEYDDIYGRTIARSVQTAAVQVVDEQSVEEVSAENQTSSVPGPSVLWSPPPPSTTVGNSTPMLIQSVPADPASSQPTQLGDHDGRTMTKAQIQALRASQGGPSQVVAPSSMGGATVQAILCPSQHPNPPQQSVCRVCRLPLTSAPVMILRPTLGLLRFSTGSTVALDRPVLIGRNPKLEGAMANEMPHLVKLDVEQGLSRTHASIRLEGWQILLEDLNSANGTVVTLPGRAPRRLHAGEPVLLEPGSHVDFGGAVACTVESV